MNKAIRTLLLLSTAIGAAWAQSPPVVSNLETAPLTFTEGDRPLFLTNSVRLSSDAPLTRVTVQLEGYVAGEDQLLLPPTEAIRSVINETDGTLLLLSYPAGSSQSAVSFQNAVRSVTYQNTNEVNPETGARTVVLRAFDDQGVASAPASRMLMVVADNDAPQVALPNDAPVAYPAGTGVAVPVFESARVLDADNERLTSAEVTISTGFQNGEDRLLLSSVPAELRITGNGSQTVTLNGPAPLATFQRALRDVAFSNQTPQGVLPTEGIRRVTTRVFDGTAESVSVSRFVVVGSPSNAPPRIQAFSREVTQGGTLTFTSDEFREQFSDPENAPFTGIYIRSKPERGALLLRGEEVTNNRINNAGPNGLRVAPSEFATLTYQAPSDYAGEDQFLWNSIDGTTFAANSKPLRIIIRPPALQLSLETIDPLNVSAGQSTPIPAIGFLANRPASATATLSVSNGTVSLPDVIVPLLTFASGDGASDPSLVFTGAVDAIAYALSGLQYTSDADYQGTETLSIGVTSGDDTDVRTTVPITVITNRLPIVSDLTVGTVENQPYVFRLVDFTDQYEDPDDAPSFGPAQIYLTEAPQNGTFVFRGDSLQAADYSSGGFAIPVAEVVAGALVYETNAEFSGSDQARWNASDGAGQAESDATILIEVLPALSIAVSEDARAICSGETDTLRVNITAGSTEGLTYAWRCPADCNVEEPTNRNSVVVRPTQTTVYVVTVANPGTAESVRDTVTVVVEECAAPTLSIPNTFTPNNDDVNDVWAIGNQGGSLPVTVEVVDRYGHLVYRSEVYQGDWDGTYEGQTLPEGTYYYLVTSAEGEVHKGPLTILR